MLIVLKKYLAVHGYIKFGRYEPKEGVDICCLVNVGEGKELANTTIKNCECKTMKEIHIEFRNNANLLKEFIVGPDKEHSVYDLFAVSQHYGGTGF